MKKSLLYGIVAMMCATIGGVKAYDGLTQNDVSALMVENIEALTEKEDGGIELFFCFPSNKNESDLTNSKPKCADDTDLSWTPSYPTGTIYPCGEEIGRNLLNRVGYCYRVK